jgi:hypothetical protein
MAQVLLDEVIHTDYGQFDLVWTQDGGFDGDPDRFFDGQVNGLVGAADPAGVYLNLARRSGGSHVRILLHDVEPALPPAEFDDVVEVSTSVPADAEPLWTAWGGETIGDLVGLHPGDFRMRVSAAGCRRGTSPPRRGHAYLVEMWPPRSHPTRFSGPRARTDATGTASGADVADPGRRHELIDLHGVRLVDADALDDGHGAHEGLRVLEVLGIEDAVAHERRRRVEAELMSAVAGDLHAATERAAGVDQVRPHVREPGAPGLLDLIGRRGEAVGEDDELLHGRSFRRPEPRVRVGRR